MIPASAPWRSSPLEQPQQKGLLGVGRGGEQALDEFGAAGLGPFARHGADLGERGVDGGDGQRRIRRRGRLGC